MPVLSLGGIGGTSYTPINGDLGTISKVKVEFQDGKYDVAEGGSIEIPTGVEFGIIVEGSAYINTIGLDGWCSAAVAIKGNGPLANSSKAYFSKTNALNLPTDLHNINMNHTFGKWVMSSADVTIERIRMWTSGQRDPDDVPASSW